MICADQQELTLRLNCLCRELTALCSLQDVPTVPRKYDVDQEGQTVYLVMEFICGRNLLKVMESNGNRPFPLDKVIEWGKALCDLLAGMHSLSPPWMLCELRPDDIMLLEDQRTIKVIDFGSAQPLNASAQESVSPPRIRRQKPEDRVYTESYAPPEQIVGRPEPRSDLFGLAATLYHLVRRRNAPGQRSRRSVWLIPVVYAPATLLCSDSNVSPLISPRHARRRSSASSRS
jgi:serine/threonine-protein kinase